MVVGDICGACVCIASYGRVGDRDRLEGYTSVEAASNVPGSYLQFQGFCSDTDVVIATHSILGGPDEIKCYECARIRLDRKVGGGAA